MDMLGPKGDGIEKRVDAFNATNNVKLLETPPEAPSTTPRKETGGARTFCEPEWTSNDGPVDTTKVYSPEITLLLAEFEQKESVGQGFGFRRLDLGFCHFSIMLIF